MTDYDITQLRGQNFGLQLVLAVCLAKISEAMPAGDQFLHTIQNLLIPKIDKILRLSSTVASGDICCRSHCSGGTNSRGGKGPRS